jgi:hypothetical protein
LKNNLFLSADVTLVFKITLPFLSCDLSSKPKIGSGLFFINSPTLLLTFAL